MSNLSYLADYQTFDDKQELNYHVDQHVKRTYEDINATDRSLFKLIARYAVKYTGAAHLKVATLAELFGKSIRTVNYVLKRLESLGMIKRVERMRRKSGGRGANIIVILPCTNEEIAEQIAERHEAGNTHAPTNERSFDENEPLRKQSSLQSSYILETASFRNSKIPEVIKETLQPFFSPKDIHNLTGIIFRAKHRHTRIEEHSEEFKTVILDVIHRYKYRKISNIEGYLYKSIRRLSRELFLDLKTYREGA